MATMTSPLNSNTTCSSMFTCGSMDVTCKRSIYHRIVIFFKLSKHVHYLIKPILRFSIFEFKSLFISCEFNIPGFIAFYAFLRG